MLFLVEYALDDCSYMVGRLAVAATTDKGNSMLEEEVDDDEDEEEEVDVG